MKNFKTKALILSFIIAVILVIIVRFTAPVEYRTSFSLQFNGIEKGINPDNTRFDYNEIISEDVLVKVFEVSEVPYDQMYKEAFTVTPVLPGGINKTIEERRKAGEDYTYFPNEFIVKIQVNNKLGLSSSICKKLATNYKDAYEDYFISRYSFPFMDLNTLISYFDYTQYDYPEYAEIFTNKFTIIKSYLDILERDDSVFKGSSEMSFKDFKSAITMVQQYDLGKISALINTHQLSKDTTLLKIKYNYLIRQNTLEQTRVFKQFEVSRDLLDIVKQNDSTLLIPGVSGETMSVTTVNQAYDYLAQSSTNAQVEFSDILHDITYYQQKLYDLENPKTPAFKRAQVVKEVDTLSAGLNQTISDWVVKINQMTHEYFDYKYAEAITSVYGMRMIRSIGTTELLGLLIVIWFALNFVFRIVFVFVRPKESTKKYKTIL